MKTFVLPLPPTVNHTYGTTSKRSGMYKLEAATSWEKQAQYYLKKSQPELIRGRVEVGIIWLLNRDRDWDGSLKLLCDALQDNGIIENDRLIYRAHVEKIVDRKYRPGRVVINIKPIVDESVPQLPHMDL